MQNYLPLKDAACLLWLKAFSGALSASPSRYNLAQADADNVAGRVLDYERALGASTSEMTRGKSTVFAKDQMKVAAVELARFYVRQVKQDVGVSAQAKIQAGIPLPTSGRAAKVPPPVSAPVLNIVGATTGSQTVGFRDSVDEGRQRPYGAKAMYLYLAVADGPATFAEARLVQGYARGPVGVGFDEAQNGKTATYWGQYVNPRLEPGPVSKPVSMTIAA